MKNHIAFKFLAVLLASLFLLSAAVSAAGIIALAALDLDPGQTVEQRFEEEMEHRWSSSADDIARRYASLTLGNAPERLVDNWYGRWYNNYPGIQGYRLEDADGNLLESEGTPEDGTACTYTVVTEYMQVTGAGPEDSTEAPEETLPETSPDGQVRTEETVPTETAAEEDAPDTAPETGTDEATIPPEEALPEQMDDAVEATAITETEPVWDEADDNIYYYPDDNGERQALHYTWEQAPEYRVTVYVSREYADMNRNPAWQLVGLVYTWRTQLMVGLGVSLLVFALLAVYLCCAAGRKPGTDVVRAGGLNRIPLDLYAFLVVLGVGCIGVVFVEEADYLLELERTLALTIVGYGGYCCALMIVGFCFAFAAQAEFPVRPVFFPVYPCLPLVLEAVAAGVALASQGSALGVESGSADLPGLLEAGPVDLEPGNGDFGHGLGLCCPVGQGLRPVDWPDVRYAAPGVAVAGGDSPALFPAAHQYRLGKPRGDPPAHGDRSAGHGVSGFRLWHAAGRSPDV